jgi:hypothetical protein
VEIKVNMMLLEYSLALCALLLACLGVALIVAAWGLVGRWGW